MKVVEILNIYNFLNSHDNYNKSGTGKITLVSMLVKFEKIVKDFENFQQEIYKRLCKNKKDFKINLIKLYKYKHNLKNKISENLPMTKKEYETFIQNDYKEILNLLQEALQPELDKEVNITYKKFTKEDFNAWVEANNINSEIAIQLTPFLLEE